MSELIKRLQAMKVGDALDWKKIRLEIHDEHERATAEAQRVALLETHRIIMDLVEKGDGIAPENLEAFRETRLRQR